MVRCKVKDHKAIASFLAIIFLLSSICYYIRITGGEAAAGMTSILMFCPAVAAFIVQIVYYRREKILGWRRCKFRYIVAGTLIPFLYLGFSYGVFWIVAGRTFTGRLSTSSVGILLLLIPSSLLTAAGEEIGWRGFLLPKMTEVWHVKTALLLSGLIWAVWHFPLMIVGLYQAGTPVWYQLPLFTIEILAVAAILGTIRLQSKSVWPAIFLHAAHNYFDQIILSPLTEDGISHYFVGETGIITAAFACLTAILLIKRTAARDVLNARLPVV